MKDFRSTVPKLAVITPASHLDDEETDTHPISVTLNLFNETSPSSEAGLLVAT